MNMKVERIKLYKKGEFQFYSKGITNSNVLSIKMNKK